MASKALDIRIRTKTGRFISKQIIPSGRVLWRRSKIHSCGEWFIEARVGKGVKCFYPLESIERFAKVTDETPFCEWI